MRKCAGYACKKKINEHIWKIAHLFVCLTALNKPFYIYIISDHRLYPSKMRGGMFHPPKQKSQIHIFFFML